MEREAILRLQIGLAHNAAEESPRTMRSMAVPLTGSLVQTYGALWLICRSPWSSSLTWLHLLGTAAFFLLVTAGAHALAVWLNRHIFGERADAPARFLVAAIWPSVVWMPLLVLLERESSVWVVLVLAVIAGSATGLLRRWHYDARGEGQEPVRAEGPISSVFAMQRTRTLVRVLVPAIATAVALEGAMAELAVGRRFSAGMLLGASTVLPVWRYPRRVRTVRADADRAPLLRGAARRTVWVFLLLAIALMPYIRSPHLSRAMRAMLRTRPPALGASSPKSHKEAAARLGAYFGVILVLPSKPKHEVVVPAAARTTDARSFGRRSVVIPFDGAYWYFKRPDERPRVGAPVVRGDPTRKEIRSTDLRPLSMEAHQRLPKPVPMSCCGAIRVTVRNAEREAGTITLEVLLRDEGQKGGASLSLGRVLIPSSEIGAGSGPGGARAEEVLSFTIPPQGKVRRFDEIVVMIQPTGARARRGAHVAVESFELVP